MKDIYVIAGPTASGKTAVAVELAKLVNGEIVSADSMQIYKGMDIGTAKPAEEEKDSIPHHMIDIVKPDEPYSAALYQQQARSIINDIHSRNQTPILCGGTGFYINAVIYDVQFAQDEDPHALYFADMAAKKGSNHIHSLLQATDPKAACAIHPNNIKRVIRALSYNRATGKLFSEYNALQKKQPEIYNSVFICLNMERQQLYDRINQRVLNMINAGLENEVERLISQGYHKDLVSMQGIGYKEIIKYFLGNCTREDAISNIQQNSRHYAKRQITWFKHQNPYAINMPAGVKIPEIIAQEISLL
ncbi:MAG: tRNA (adenosine(37)-N6)-dimethylallyltransferase MiaA [Defluviitaleaceae bacterium]|nr:tRNA (adenosine(37)-N6)-dimethylallyltransferase MiaA [Defluviitaleaceae bacterium]